MKWLSPVLVVVLLFAVAPPAQAKTRVDVEFPLSAGVSDDTAATRDGDDVKTGVSGLGVTLSFPWDSSGEEGARWSLGASMYTVDLKHSPESGWPWLEPEHRTKEVAIRMFEFGLEMPLAKTGVGRQYQSYLAFAAMVGRSEVTAEPWSGGSEFTESGRAIGLKFGFSLAITEGLSIPLSIRMLKPNTVAPPNRLTVISAGVGGTF